MPTGLYVVSNGAALCVTNMNQLLSKSELKISAERSALLARNIKVPLLDGLIERYDGNVNHFTEQEGDDTPETMDDEGDAEAVTSVSVLSSIITEKLLTIASGDPVCLNGPQFVTITAVRHPFARPGATNRSLLLRAGDVEENPGPTKGGKKQVMKKVAKVAAKEISLLDQATARMKSTAQRQMKREPHGPKAPSIRAPRDMLTPAERIEADKYVLAMVAPDPKTAPVRWRSQYTSALTAVASPLTRYEADWNTVDATAKNLTAFGFRDPLRHTVIPDRNAAGATYVYRGYYTNVVANSGGSRTINPIPNSALSLTAEVTDNPVAPQDYELDAAYWAHVPGSSTGVYTTAGPHGPTLFSGTINGKSEERRLVYLEGGSIVTFSIAGNIVGSSTAVFRAVLHKLEGDKLQKDAKATTNIAVATPTVNLTVDISGYYAMDLQWRSGLIDTDSTGNVLGISVQFSGNGPVYRHLPIPGLLDNLASAQTIRIIGHSLMYTNRASALAREGQVAGLQLSVGSNWLDYVTFDQVTVSGTNASSGSTNQVTVLQADQGMYISARPSQTEDMDLYEYYARKGFQLTDSFYPVVPRSGVILLAMNVLTTAGRNGYWTVCTSLEYETLDPWRVVARSEMPEHVTAAALDLVRDVPNCVENPLHMAKILASIKRGIKIGAGFVIEHGPAAIEFAKLAKMALA